MDLSKYILHDLSQPYTEDTPGFSWDVAKTLLKNGWNARTLNIYSHSGTHMDAPYHFGLDGTIDQLSLDRCMGKSWIARISIQKNQQLIRVDDLGPSVLVNFEKGDSLILNTNWNPDLGWDSYRDDLPRVSEELAHWCVENQVNMLGVEPPSVADVNNLKEVTAIHQILLSGGVTIIEGLVHIDQIKADDVILIALPLKISKGDGAPARVMALEEKK